MVNFTCNSTLEDLRIVSEVPIAGELNFHQLGLIVCSACALIAILLSFYLMWMHALHYTRPYEQRHIIRILFMIPVYSTASLLSFIYYGHAIYFEVLRDCYEAFAIASFFALLCHYVAPNLHDQKNYFRALYPITGWVWPLSWWKCCGGREKGPFRTPRSGLTWFNIIWTGIYQYCFIRVAMTITASVTQYFGRYCQSSDSPVFAHIWVLVIEGVAVTIAMFCVIQFYVQMRHDIGQHRPFLKVLAIKLVIFLSFWQSFGISALTGPTFNVIKETPTLAYPDISVGIPSLLVCIEMACFAVLHIFAYPYKPYTKDGAPIVYPVPGHSDSPQVYMEHTDTINQGGMLGIRAFADAMNPFDLVKAFARGMRWLFVGVRSREKDSSYKNSMSLEATAGETGYKSANSELPIADEFRRSKFGIPTEGAAADEGAGLIAHAQPNPSMNAQSPRMPGGNSSTSNSRHGSPRPGQYTPARLRYDPVTGQEVSAEGRRYDPATGDEVHSLDADGPVAIGMATPYGESQRARPQRSQQDSRTGGNQGATAETSAAHAMLWNQGAPQAQGQSRQYERPYDNQI